MGGPIVRPIPGLPKARAEAPLPPLTCLSVFSGIGGDALAARRAGFEIIGLCEIEPFCRAILRHNFPCVPITEDIHEVPGKNVEISPLAPVTLLTGSSPFEANYARGVKRVGDPHWLWDEFARVAREVRPNWVVAEMFSRFSQLGLDDCSWDLERAGYSATAIVLPSQALDCPQRIERLFLVGATREGPQLPYREPADHEDVRIEPWPLPGPRLCRMATGFPYGVDHHSAALFALGDSTVPRTAEAIFRAIARTELEFIGHRASTV